MHSTLKDILPSSQDFELRTLPVLHTCEANDLYKILNEGQLKTSFCHIFQKDYLYAFYGIPSYRTVNLKETGSFKAYKNTAYYPVCFILDYDKIINTKKIYALDSGAFASIPEIKNDHFHDSVELDQLEIGPDLENAKKMIKLIYGSNKNYIKGMPQCNSSNAPQNGIPIINTTALSYLSLVNDQSCRPYDNRANTIEFIFDENISLNEGSILQVIAPGTYLDDPDISGLLNKYGVFDPISYHTFRGNPTEFIGSISNSYYDFLISKKWL